jgi:hypothetical protein
MAASVRVWLLLAVGSALVTFSADAVSGIPDPAFCVCPNLMSGRYWINLVASRSGVIDPHGAFTVVARDNVDQPIVGVPIKIIFNCPDLRIGSGIVAPGIQVDCGPPVNVTAITDGNGVASFLIGGAAVDLGGNPTGCGNGGASVYLDSSILICYANVTAVDLNGGVANPGVEITDLSAWLSDFSKISVGTIGYKARSDFNHNGTVEITDLSQWMKALGRGLSSQGCGTYCP